MSYRRVIYFTAVATLGIACVSADALAARVAARGGAVGVRSGAVGVRGGAVGVRGGAVGYRGGVGYGGRYGGGYYRPGVGLATGALVGGAIAASQPYGGYGYSTGYYNPDYSTGYYDPGYSTGYSNPGYSNPSYSNPGYSTNYTYGGYAGNAPVPTPASAQPIYGNPGAPAGGGGSGGGLAGVPEHQMNSFGKCWINDDRANYRWGDCPHH